MSVVGIDLGSVNAVVAVVRRGGIDVISNEVSRRQTASMVGFSTKNRELGESAKSNWKRNFRRTVFQPVRMIGLKYENVEDERSFMGAAQLVEGAGGNVEAKMMIPYLEEPSVQFRAEQLVASLLTKLKETTEKSTDSALSDVVISVPGYYTDEEIRAVQNAAQLAGINALRVISNVSATAVYYLYRNKSKLADEENRDIMVIDCGGSNTSAAIVRFNKNSFKVLGSAYNRQNGGRDIDIALANYFCDKFQQEHGEDLRKMAKPWYRVLAACEKVKKSLNLGAVGSINEMCIYEEFDMAYNITKEEYTVLLQPIIDKLVATVNECVANTGIEVAALHSVQWVGGTMRIKEMQETVATAIGRTVENNINAEESCACGAALQCAFLSPRISLPYTPHVGDIQNIGINLTYQTEGDDAKVLALVKKGSFLIPKSKDGKLKVLNKKLELPKQPIGKTITLRLSYAEPDLLAPGLSEDIAIYTTDPVPQMTPENETEKIRFMFKHDSSGVCNLVSSDVVVVTDVEYQEKVLIENDEEDEADEAEEDMDVDSPKETEDAEGEGAEDENMEEADDTANKKAPRGKKAKKKAAKKKAEPKYETVTKTKKETKYHPLMYSTQGRKGFTEERLRELVQFEQKLRDVDNAATLLLDTRNSLESYVYNSRSKLQDEWQKWSNEEERKVISTAMDGVEAWLYGDGMDADQKALDAKTAEAFGATKVVTDRIEEDKRQREEAERKAREEAEAAAKKAEEERLAAEKAEKERLAAEKAAAEAEAKESPEETTETPDTEAPKQETPAEPAQDTVMAEEEELD